MLHPVHLFRPAKQDCARRLADSALAMVYHRSTMTSTSLAHLSLLALHASTNAVSAMSRGLRHAAGGFVLIGARFRDDQSLWLCMPELGPASGVAWRSPRFKSQVAAPAGEHTGAITISLTDVGAAGLHEVYPFNYRHTRGTSGTGPVVPVFDCAAHDLAAPGTCAWAVRQLRHHCDSSVFQHCSWALHHPTRAVCCALHPPTRAVCCALHHPRAVCCALRWRPCMT